MKRIYASAICILIPVILQAKPALEIVLNSSQDFGKPDEVAKA